ncbi:MAG: hypothetical protein QY306_10135 [Anaerolineales bacterium]|nr:MAG: hypothetical protein QY306_10135 [Anaerolineales bacterium]
MKSLKRISIAIAVTGLMFLSIFCYWYDRDAFYPSGLISDFPNLGAYRVNSSMILVDLNQGKTKVFEQAFDLDTSTITPFSYGSFPWKQADYLRIAEAFYQFVWNESLSNWQVYQMDFSRGCQDSSTGFDSGSIILYKNADLPTHYIARFLGIYPLKEVVRWGEGEFNKPLFGWKNIDLESMNVNADDALQIAEDKGGTAFRLDVENECTISVSLKRNPIDDNDWFISYNDKRGLKTFSIRVNPYSASP